MLLTNTQREGGLELPGLEKEGKKEKTLALDRIWVKQQERTELEAGGTNFSMGVKQKLNNTDHVRLWLIIILISSELLACKVPRRQRNGELSSAQKMGQEGIHLKRRGAEVTLRKGSSVE